MRFLCSSPLGKIIKINDVLKYEVAGVYKARPQHSNVKFDVIMPIPPINRIWMECGGISNVCFAQRRSES